MLNLGSLTAQFVQKLLHRIKHIFLKKRQKLQKISTTKAWQSDNSLFKVKLDLVTHLNSVKRKKAVVKPSKNLDFLEKYFFLNEPFHSSRILIFGL